MRITPVAIGTACLIAAATFFAFIVGCRSTDEYGNADLPDPPVWDPAGKLRVMEVPRKSCAPDEIDRLEWCAMTIYPLPLGGMSPDESTLLAKAESQLGYAVDDDRLFVHFQGSGDMRSTFEGRDCSRHKLVVNCTHRDIDCALHWVGRLVNAVPGFKGCT
jgi:hypothetical protein